jgi:hypothetical protein
MCIPGFGEGEKSDRGTADKDGRIGRRLTSIENKPPLDGYSVGTTNSVKPWNWFTTRDAWLNTILHLTARWMQLLISRNL